MLNKADVELDKRQWVHLVRLQDIPSGQVVRIRLKIVGEKKTCRLFGDILSSATLNDLTMTFTSRLKMDAKCADQQ